MFCLLKKVLMIWNLQFTHRLAPPLNDYFANTQKTRKYTAATKLPRILLDTRNSVYTRPQFLTTILQAIYLLPTFVKKKIGENWDGQGTSYTPGKDKMYGLGSVPEAEESV